MYLESLLSRKTADKTTEVRRAHWAGAWGPGVVIPALEKQNS